MSDVQSDVPEPGEWVLVWGQVVEDKPHPEDLVVAMASHSDQYHAVVRKDRVMQVSNPPDFAETCTALKMTSIGYLWRCDKVLDHGGVHASARNDGYSWREGETTGYIEERAGA